MCLLSLLTACGSARTAERAAPASRPDAVLPQPTMAVGLYGAEEALRDALSGPLVYLGTGPWPGIARMHACAFRNDRVLVVNIYCGIKDTQAFRVEVYSPTRGRVRLYAESRAPVAQRARHEYASFMMESEPPPSLGVPLRPLDLNMTLADLQSYEQARYAAYLPACYSGIEMHKPRSGCLGPLAPESAGFGQRNASFLERASDDWYRLVRELRALSERYGRDP
jgi:hypothetical protein